MLECATDADPPGIALVGTGASSSPSTSVAIRDYSAIADEEPQVQMVDFWDEKHELVIKDHRLRTLLCLSITVIISVGVNLNINF